MMLLQDLGLRLGITLCSFAISSMFLLNCTSSSQQVGSVQPEKKAATTDQSKSNQNSQNALSNNGSMNAGLNQTNSGQAGQESSIKPTSLVTERTSGNMLIPVTGFSNMENGYQATNDGSFVVLKDESGQEVARGRVGMEALIDGFSTENQGSAYTSYVLNVGLTKLSSKAYEKDGSYSGKLSICIADDKTKPLDEWTCRNLSSSGMSPVDRPFQWIETPVKYSTKGTEIKIDEYTGGNNGEGSQYAKALATHHPVMSFAAPGSAFKDFQSPLVLDLNFNKMMDVIDPWDKSISISFDFNGSGEKVRTGWITPEEGFLALDINKNKVIDNGTELFGEFFGASNEKSGKTFENGFQALAQYDLNKDGKIDAKDAVFKDLVVWRDLNMNGVADPFEIKTIEELKIAEISLAYKSTNSNEKPLTILENEIRLVALFTMTDGKKFPIADIWFKQRRLVSEK